MTPPPTMVLTLPLNRVMGRVPTVSQGFHAPNHLGIDYVWPWQEGDPTDPVRRSRHGKGGFVCLPGALQLAVADSFVLYSEWRDRGWATRIRTKYGFDACYMHAVRGTARVQPRQHVAEGEVIAEVGADPTDPEGFAHLHFEIRVPVNEGVSGRDGWGCLPTDPWPWLRTARLIEVPTPDL